MQPVGLQLPKDPKERQEEVERHVAASIDLLASELSQGFSENFIKLLSFYSRFHQYSARNALLILLQRSDAAKVASYKKWQELGRQVAKGSKAIWVYAPLTKREQDAVTGEPADKIFGWRLVPVFADLDLEQIDTDPLPILWKPLPDDCQHLVERVTQGLTARGVEVVTRRIKSGTQGYATSERIVLSSAITDSRNRLATLLHEAAHWTAHFGATANDKNKPQCEMEAEATAYVVLHRLGIVYPFSADYLRSHGITPDDLRESMTVIGGLSKRLLKLLEDQSGQQAA